MKTGLILLNWNNFQDTVSCIDSLKNGTNIPDSILIWDNNSTDNSCFEISKAHPDVQLISHPQNIGFAEANNLAVNILLDDQCDLIWILNNDTVVLPDCLQNLICFLEANPSYQAVTGRINYMHQPEVIWYAGGIFKHMVQDAVHLGMNQSEKTYQDQAGAIDFMTGCCMLIKKETLRAHPLFQPHFFAYCEDLEWSLRMKTLSIPLGYTPEAKLFHKGSATVKKNMSFTGTLSPLQHRLQTRNRLWILRTLPYNPFRKSFAYCWLIGRFLRFAFINVLLWRLNKVSAIFQGMFEGLQAPKNRI